MNKLFVSSDIEKKIKSLGFSDLSIGYDIERVYSLPPIHQQVLDWLREKHELDISIVPVYKEGENKELIVIYSFDLYAEEFEEIVDDGISFDSYYDALNASIWDAIKTIEERKKKNA